MIDLWPDPIVTPQALLEARLRQLKIEAMNGRQPDAVKEFTNMLALFRELEIGKATMRNAKLLLESLTRQIPPGEGQRHNITLASSDHLEVCLMLGEKYIPVILQDSDLERPIDDLVNEIIFLTKPFAPSHEQS